MQRPARKRVKSMRGTHRPFTSGERVSLSRVYRVTVRAFHFPLNGQRCELYHTPPERATARREKCKRAAPPDSSQHQTRQAVRRGNLSGNDSGKPQPFDRAPVYPPPSNAATAPRLSAVRPCDRGEHRTPRTSNTATYPATVRATIAGNAPQPPALAFLRAGRVRARPAVPRPCKAV